LPFLGEVQQLRGALHDGIIVFKLPAIEKGAVLWLEGAARDKTAKKTLGYIATWIAAHRAGMKESRSSNKPANARIEAFPRL